MSRLLSLCVGVLAVAGFVLERRRGNRRRSALVLVLAPVALLAVNSYGEEIHFRAYLFALPGLAFFAATVLWPPGTRPTLSRQVGVGAVSMLLMGGLLFAQYGNDRRAYFTEAEVEAAEYVYRTAPEDSLLVSGSRNYPAMSEEYDKFVYLPADEEPPATRRRLVRDPEGVLGPWMNDDDTSASYLIITRSQIAENEALQTFPGGGLKAVRAQLMSSPEFTPVFRSRDAVVFVTGQGAEVPAGTREEGS